MLHFCSIFTPSGLKDESGHKTRDPQVLGKPGNCAITRLFSEPGASSCPRPARLLPRKSPHGILDQYWTSEDSAPNPIREGELARP